MEGALNDILKFLQIGARLDLKAVALEHVLGLTGTSEGIKVLIEEPILLASLIALLYDNNATISKDSSLCLVNISANDDGAEKLLQLNVGSVDLNAPLQNVSSDIVDAALRLALDKDSHIADPCCMILSNLTRPTRFVETVVDVIEKLGLFDSLIKAFTNTKHNTKGAHLNYIAPLLSNLSQSSCFRKKFLDRNGDCLQKLLPFVEFKDSLLRRGGIAGLIKNCCFDQDQHEWLLSEEIDVLPRLLLPLAGNEEYDEEDNDKLPLELQYLPEDKKREADPDIRLILLEALLQLCSRRRNREFIRDKNAYVILRDLHKCEKDKKVLLACENVIDILIRTEDEIGEDNLKDLPVTDELKEKFKKMDEQYLQDD